MENQTGTGGLEDRLRNMILARPENQLSQPPMPAMGGLIPAGQGQAFPVNSQPSPPLAKSKHKRPNQAERRQRSAQLSIPIDTRPQMNQPMRPYFSPPGYPHTQYTNAGQNHVRRPHSATFRPPSQGTTLPGGPGPGPFPPHPRHHPSLSYNGPMSSGDWHQPRTSGGDQRTPPHGARSPFDMASPRTSRHHGSNSYDRNGFYRVRPEELKMQADMLEGLCNTIIADAEIEPADIYEKENFRCRIEEIARRVITQYEIEVNGFHDFPPASVQLRCFGSLSSGFATKAADMDLGLLSPLSAVQPDAPGSPIPRLIEKAFLEMGLGARLLSRTRIPIIKICERPPEELRAALLDEREKWENGLPEGHDEDDIHGEADVNLLEETQPNDGKHHDREPSISTKDDITLETRLRSLKQGDKRTLAAYYSGAKGILRKVGGRDMTYSNSRELSRSDLTLLNEFNLVFVNGLADDNLKRRLLTYRSLSELALTANTNYRTLHGVYTQMEGESLAMMWESREIRERDEVREKNASSLVRNWQAICNRASFGQDPLGYAKELQHGFEQLKTIPSIQVMLLAQGQHEAASAYLARAQKLMTDLGVLDHPSENNQESLNLVVRHYIQGIYNEGIRHEIEAFASALPKASFCLRVVARRHQSLQLAQEYEKCLEKGLYPDQAVASIRSYVEILRGPMVSPQTRDSAWNLVVPLSPDADRIMSNIRLFGDPARKAPNQPRDPYKDRLEFPKSGVGVQCDINFSAHLALHNTLLLRCYSLCDPRVRPLVLFVKHWAKMRQINSPYRGTLSSYGYVLMMLHYLVNIAQPFVCPNLQQLARPPDPNLTPQQMEDTVVCKGKNVQFWRDEAEIQRLASENTLTQNRDSIGHLLRGFFEYYAHSNQMSTVPCRGFDWGRDVISLRTHGGLLSKQEKGWTGAKTIVEVNAAAPPPPGGLDHPLAKPNNPIAEGPQSSQAGGDPLGSPATGTGQQAHAQAQPPREVREIRHRYLFAIEDPFELDHNVARTVTHNGIVAIRDEFRRAWSCIKAVGSNNPEQHGSDLLEDVALAEQRRESELFARLLEELHGPRAS
ncbi:Poly(A) RNA polymerase protein cid1 [Echria macrotheca]|uniref:polynucleotide adenylyltransferase n=1 Tax=Echria macrotheca TaxID=438768 RepID=A0AAJ0BKB2_9PEZI|nr:Poly(A) RNA polymerase protein cid1 [Echria macrotheca]